MFGSKKPAKAAKAPKPVAPKPVKKAEEVAPAPVAEVEVPAEETE
jgi:hypothetical protein